MKMNNIDIEDKVVMKKVSDVKPYDRNPRRNNRTVDMLCEIIPKVGFNVPLVIDENGVIVKGHARYKAALKLGMDEVPCIITHASAEAIKADRIADNKISEFSEWVNEELMHEVDMLDFDFDFNKIGIPTISYDDMFSDEEFEEMEGGDEEDNEESRKERYQKFLESQMADVQMTSEEAIQAAVYKQIHTPKAPREYRKCICAKCGNVMFFDKNVLYGKNGTVRRR